jgi:hypothetical protein
MKELAHRLFGRDEAVEETREDLGNMVPMEALKLFLDRRSLRPVAGDERSHQRSGRRVYEPRRIRSAASGSATIASISAL